MLEFHCCGRSGFRVQSVGTLHYLGVRFLYLPCVKSVQEKDFSFATRFCYCFGDCFRIYLLYLCNLTHANN